MLFMSLLTLFHFNFMSSFTKQMLNKGKLPTADKLMKHATTSKLTIVGKEWITSVISHMFLSCAGPAVNTFWRQYSGVPGRIL